MQRKRRAQNVHAVCMREEALRLVRSRLAALAAGGFLLRSRAALRRVAARGTGTRGLATAARRSRRIRDLRRALLRHPLVLQRLVLLLVLDVCALVGHELQIPLEITF